MKKSRVSPNVQLPIYRQVIAILYFVALAAMAVMILLNMVLKSSPGADYGLGQFETMNDEWLTDSGSGFEIAHIDDLRTDGSRYVSVYHLLPQTIGRDQSLLFRSKNCSVEVFLGEEPVYSTDLAEAPFYNHSPGTRWNVVNIPGSAAGQMIELRVEQAYQDGRAKVDNFYYGDRAAIVLYLIQEKLVGCVVSLLIFFVGILFFATWLVLNWRRSPKENSLLWLAIFAMVASCWCLLETNLFQLFSQHLRLIQVVDNMMLVVGGLPLYLYMDCIYHVFRRRTVRILCAANVAYVLLATLSQLLGGWDYHQTLNGAVATYGIVIVILIGCLIRQSRGFKTLLSQNDRLFHLLQQAGILLMGLGLLGDLTRYLTSDVMDRAFFIRIGLLCFIICFGAGNIYQMIQLVQKGQEADFISRLAYLDGLTEMGNRTAYIEQLQRLKAEHPNDSLALVMFDINDLKWVNDTLGHKEGDGLILRCAQILRDAFDTSWSLYRIGGDEFMALKHGGDVQADYRRAMTLFLQAVREADETEKAYPTVIAHGAAFCQRITRQTVEQTEKEADQNMYQNKNQLKQAAGIQPAPVFGSLL